MRSTSTPASAARRAASTFVPAPPVPMLGHVTSAYAAGVAGPFALALLDGGRVELTADELASIDALETGVRGGPEPDAITLEAFGRDIPEA